MTQRFCMCDSKCEQRVEVSSEDMREMNLNPRWYFISNRCKHGPYENSDVLIRRGQGYKIFVALKESGKSDIEILDQWSLKISEVVMKMKPNTSRTFDLPFVLSATQFDYMYNMAYSKRLTQPGIKECNISKNGRRVKITIHPKNV